MATSKLVKVQPERPTRTSRKKEITKDKLLNAMQILLLEKGYENININEITELADIALGTFYNYFDSKASILSAVMDLLVINYHLDVDYVTQSLDDPAEKIAASIGYTLSKVIDGSGLGKLIFASGIPVDVYTRVFRDRGLADIKEGTESNRFVNSDPDIAISMVIGGRPLCGRRSLQ